MNLSVVGQAVVLFAVTKVDDLLLLALYFANGGGRRGLTRDIALGQYLGFAGILMVAVAAALGATFLPEWAVPYLGLLPLALGVKAAVQAWRRRRDPDEGTATTAGGPRVAEIAVVTLANGGDNIGVYVPVFVTAGVGGMSTYVVVFLGAGGRVGRCRALLRDASGHREGTGSVGARVCCRWC